MLSLSILGWGRGGGFLPPASTHALKNSENARGPVQGGSEAVTAQRPEADQQNLVEWFTFLPFAGTRMTVIIPPALQCAICLLSILLHERKMARTVVV